MSSPLTFLFLGGAKRVAMARMIAHACKVRGRECRIVGYELTRQCPLAAVGEIVEGLKWSDPNIFGHLEDVVARYEVDVVIPFVDGAVGVASEFAERCSVRKVFSPTSERTVAEEMFDKCASAALFEKLGLPVPATYRPGDPCLRLIAKPRFGSASKGIVAINTLQKLDEMLSMSDSYLIQERIDNREELTVDCYVGVSSGKIVAVSPRVRLEVSGGEAVRTVTVDDAEATGLARQALGSLNLRGAVTVQLIRDLDTGQLMIMEINPRLGGGAVASVNAGADLPGLIVDDALGDSLTPTAAEPGVLTVRYLEDVVFYPDSK